MYKPPFKSLRNAFTGGCAGCQLCRASLLVAVGGGSSLQPQHAGSWGSGLRAEHGLEALGLQKSWLRGSKTLAQLSWCSGSAVPQVESSWTRTEPLSPAEQADS